LHRVHRRFDTQRLLSKKTARYGGQGKGAGAAPALLLCKLSLFLCSRSHREKPIRSDAGASEVKRPVIVPHTAKDVNLSLDLQGSGLSFLGGERESRYALLTRRSPSIFLPATGRRRLRRDQQRHDFKPRVKWRGFLFDVRSCARLLCLYAVVKAIPIRLSRANFGPAPANFAYRSQNARFLLFLDIVRHALRIHCASTFAPRS
jgi:hypothetical protein